MNEAVDEAGEDGLRPNMLQSLFSEQVGAERELQIEAKSSSSGRPPHCIKMFKKGEKKA